MTNGRLGLRNLWRQDEGWNTNVRFRARFDLPNLRDKAYVFIGRQNERELVTDNRTFTRERLLKNAARKTRPVLLAWGGLRKPDCRWRRNEVLHPGALSQTGR